MDAEALPSAIQQRKVREVLEAEKLLRQLVNDKDVETGGEHRQQPAIAPPAFEHGLSNNVLWSQEDDKPAFWQYMETGAQTLRRFLSEEDAGKAVSEKPVPWTVVLSRPKKEKWGFAWEKYRFYAKEQRIVEQIQAGSVAAKWNERSAASGHPDRCIIAGDRLMCANGRTAPREIAVALEGDEVVLEFERRPTREQRQPVHSKKSGLVQSSAISGEGYVSGNVKDSPKACNIDATVSGDVKDSPNACNIDVEMDADMGSLQEQFADSPMQVLNSAGRSASGGSVADTLRQPRTAPPQSQNVSPSGKESISQLPRRVGQQGSQPDPAPSCATEGDSRLSTTADPSETGGPSQSLAAMPRRFGVRCGMNVQPPGCGPAAAQHSIEASQRPVVRDFDDDPEPSPEESDSEEEGSRHVPGISMRLESDAVLRGVSQEPAPPSSEPDEQGALVESTPSAPVELLSPSAIAAQCMSALASDTELSSAAPGGPQFELAVQLADTRIETMKFHIADMAEVVDAFVSRVKLNAMFKEPLIAHGNLMVQTDKRSDQVDVVDLI